MDKKESFLRNINKLSDYQVCELLDIDVPTCSLLKKGISVSIKWNRLIDFLEEMTTDVE
jgi:hypothetical protein